MFSFNPRRFAWIAAALCIACCAFVPILVVVGISGIVGLATYLDYGAIGFLIASLVLFGHVLFRA